MLRDAIRGLNSLTRWERLAVGLWSAALVAVSALALLSQRHSLCPIFTGAARHWLTGADLYQPCAEAYRYSPLVAVLFVPLSLLPDPLGGLLWRWLSAAIFVGALAWWCRAVLPRPLTRGQMALLFLLVLPLSVGNLYNGQSNTLLIGLLLAAVAALAPEARPRAWRFALAGACVALATLFKGYPIALGLLLALIQPRRFGRWLLLALAAGLLLPFLFQRPDYVAEQYIAWLHHLQSNDRHLLPRELWYRDFQLLCWMCHVPLGSRAYLVVQFLTGAGVAAVCLMARALDRPKRPLLTLLTVLGCCWMTSFGPATESATYILLAPAAAWVVLEAWLERRPAPVRGVLLAAYLLLTAAQLANWLPNGRSFQALGPQPLAGLLLLGGTLAGAFLDLRRQAKRRERALRSAPAGVAWLQMRVAVFDRGANAPAMNPEAGVQPAARWDQHEAIPPPALPPSHVDDSSRER
jgi:hypothetical protein